MKKFLIWISLFLVSFMNFSFVFAEVPINTSTEQAKKTAQDIKNLQLFAEGLYSAVWPMLTLAGAFMSNSVVYGSFIWMDVMLWKLWNVMRVFANYIIWFILIFSIFTLFLWWKFEKFNPIKLLPQLAVAAVLVNMSWFLIWVCIDISNILTYAVGKLPIHVDNSKTTEVSFVKPAIKFDSKKNDPIVLWIADKNNNIIPFCSLTMSGDYYIVKDAYTKTTNKNSKNEKSFCSFYYKWKFYELEVWKKSKKISDLVKWANEIKPDKTKWTWIMWPLFTIYGSFLNIADTVTFHSWDTASMYMETFMKLIFLIAFVIPLIALTVILVVRVVLIWMYIVFSPFIFLFTPLKWIWEKLLWEKWKLSNMCCMIFLPVFVVFAMSMSFVFIKSINFNDKSWEWLMYHLWIIPSHKDNSIVLDIVWTPDYNIKIKVDKVWANNVYVNNFSELDKFLLVLIKRIFWIWFTWIMVFTALKSCKLTSKIASSIQTFSQWMLASTPFIPVAGGQSIASLKQWLWFLKQLPGQWQQDQFQKIQKYINEMQRDTSWVEKKAIVSGSKSVSTLETSAKTGLKTTIKSISNNNDLKNIQVSDLLNDTNKQKLKTIASKLWLSTDKLKELLNSQSGTISSVLSNPDIQEKIKKEQLKDKIKSIIEKDVLGKKITLLQLNEDAKTELKRLINEVFWQEVEIESFDKAINDNKWLNLIKLLKCEFKFSEEDIVKLLLKDLIDDGVESNIKPRVLRLKEKGINCSHS